MPLSRVEIGEVWNTPTELSMLEITTLPRGWSTALETFIPLVEYSQDYLRHMLSVLRTMQYMNDTPLDLSTWKRACKTTNDMLYVVITCPKCRTIRYLSMRTLLISSTKQKPLYITCEDLDLMCEQHWDEVIDATLGSTSTTQSNKPKRVKTEHFDLSDDASSQVTPSKPPQTKVTGNEKPNEFVTWSQIAQKYTPNMSLNALSVQQYYDPYDSTQAAPEHFISGHPLVKFVTPDPIPSEIHEYKNIVNTSTWRDMFRDFSKWSDSHKEAQYNGDEDISAVFRWSTAMRARFLNPYVSNNVMRAELASATLTHRARSWWLAHRTRTPNLLITFDQLLEWIKRELVPHSSTTDAVNAWSDLSYTGDIKKYINDLERLINHFPLRRESIIIMATKPLGKDIQNRIQMMDLQHGPTGINIAQLKNAIKGFLSTNQSFRNINRSI